MAGEDDDTERSEDPTQRKLDQALERGDVAKSQEVNTWFVIAASTLIVYGFASSMGGDIGRLCRGLIENSYKFNMEGKALVGLMQKIGVDLLAACLLYTSPSPRDRQKSRMPSSA